MKRCKIRDLSFNTGFPVRQEGLVINVQNSGPIILFMVKISVLTVLNMIKLIGNQF